MNGNDEPTLSNHLPERENMIRNVARDVAGCSPPQVFGIHGDWGAGKTSFLHQLHRELTGECPQSLDVCGKPVREGWKPADNVAVVWFEAWRYQYEESPVVALLQEIREQLSRKEKFIRGAKKLGEVAAYGALFSLECVTNYLGVKPMEVQKAGERWEKQHYATKLPTHIIREFLNDAIEALLKPLTKKVAKKAEPKPRVVVLVDDLDRCEGEAAYRLLEGIKIYMSIPSCVFVLGMDQRLIKLAVANHIPIADNREKRLLAEEYVEKICRDIRHLPLVRDPSALLAQYLDAAPGKDGLVAVAQSYRCLPANPRRIKEFAHVLRRFAAHIRCGMPESSLAEFQDCTLLKDRCNTADGLVVVMASLYCYHYEDTYRYIEGDPSFCNLVRRWAEGRLDTRSAGRFDAMTLTDTPTQSDESLKSVSRAPTLEPAFADPMRRNVFRVQQLIRDLGEVEAPLIEACLLGTTNE